MSLPDRYHYTLPSSAIAQCPASPRDAAGLLVYNRRTQKVAVGRFLNLDRYLPTRAVLVFNDTKVIPARFAVTKPTGGKSSLLYLGHERTMITALADRRLELGWKLRMNGRVSLTVVRHVRREYRLRPSVSISTFLCLLHTRGKTPLPPYLRHSSLTEGQRKKLYQSFFAKRPGSVAAPTASLHFTARLMTKLKRQGIALEFVTLHVGLGTFAPVTDEHLRRKKLHAEQYEITPAAAARLNRSKAQGRPIIAVGTTVARTLESAARRGRLISGRRETEIFIQPDYRWKFVDGLITNFHVPKSSLLMLVSSLVGREKLLTLYQYALRKKFRFFSFGDGMLVV